MWFDSFTPTPQATTAEEYLQGLSVAARYRWCSPTPLELRDPAIPSECYNTCACIGCANRVERFGWSRADWQRWVDTNPRAEVEQNRKPLELRDLKTVSPDAYNYLVAIAEEQIKIKWKHPPPPRYYVVLLKSKLESYKLPPLQFEGRPVDDLLFEFDLISSETKQDSEGFYFFPVWECTKFSVSGL